MAEFKDGDIVVWLPTKNIPAVIRKLDKWPSNHIEGKSEFRRDFASDVPGLWITTPDGRLQWPLRLHPNKVEKTDKATFDKLVAQIEVIKVGRIIQPVFRLVWGKNRSERSKSEGYMFDDSESNELNEFYKWLGQNKLIGPQNKMTIASSVLKAATNNT